MAKNEAKIKFTAETGGFNQAIKQANNEMAQLRAEMKLNETQMKTTGASVEGLENKHRILSNQLSAAEDKTAALSQKVNKAAEIFGENSEEVTKLKTQLLNAQNAEEKLRQAVNSCEQELTDQKNAAKEAESATGQLTDKISSQQAALNRMKSDYVEAALKYGEASDEAKKLEQSIGELSSELKENQSALSSAADKADEFDRSLDGAGDSAADSGGGFTIMKGAIADLVSAGIQAGIGKIKEFTSYLAELPAATMELRQDLATLTTSFDTMGFSTKTAKNTWTDLYAVFGEDDRAVETANNISKMAKNQEDLNDWVTITTGVWGSYQDSLPVEGLAEASNETAKTGKVTGVLADALNWSGEAATMFADYMSDDVVTAEDAFNAALEECNSEQERQKLITETLTSLYGDAADKYRDTAGAQMEAKEAAAENMQAEAELAATVEPVTTEFTKLKTELMQGAQPAIEKVSGALTDAVGWMREHPTVVKAVGAAVGVLAVGFTGLAVALGIYTVAQWAMNAAVLANPITWIAVGIVAAIAAVVGIGVALYENWDKIKKKASEVWSGVKEKWESLKAATIGKFTEIKEKGSEKWDSLKKSVVDKASDIKDKASEKWDKLKSDTSNKFSDAKDKASSAWSKLKSNISKDSDSTRSKASSAWDKLKSKTSTAFSTGKDKATSAWSKLKAKITSDSSETESKSSSKFNSLKNKVTSYLSSAKDKGISNFSKLKSGLSSGASGAYSVVSSKFNAIKNSIAEKMNSAREKVSSAISRIKGLFNFSWSLPKIKVPKFHVSGGKAPWGFGGKGSLPSVSVTWNAKGAIFTKPTIFDTAYGFQGVGEAGAEAVLPIDRLQGYIDRAFNRNIIAYSSEGGDVYNFYVNDATINGTEEMRSVAKNFITEMVRLGGMNK